MRCVILTSDTAHHRYFVNRVSRLAETTVVLERMKLNRWKRYRQWVAQRRSLWALINNPYLPVAHPVFQHRQDAFEELFFADGIPPVFDGHAALCAFQDVNDPECVRLVMNLNPDLLISFGTGLIKEELLSLQGLKINVHRGILPKYRGLDSDLWAAYFCDFENVGTTIHKLFTTFDTGDILCQERVKIQRGMKAHQMRYYTTVLAAEMVERIVCQMKEGKEPAGIPQNRAEGHYYSYIPPIPRWLAVRRFNTYVRTLG